jgi:hypothetical protein
LASAVKQVFISYATEDTDFAHRLADDLKRLGARVWIAPDSILAGESWVDAIERGLSESSHVIMVLTPAALEAPGVKMERDMAIDLALKDQIKVISLPVKPCEVPLVLRRYQMLLAFQEDYEAGLNQLGGQLGLQAVPPRSEDEIVAPLAPKPTARKERVSTWQRLRLPLEVFGLLAIVLLVGVMVSGLIGGGEEPALVPTTSVPAVAAQPTPTHTPQRSSATSTSIIVIDTPPSAPTSSPTATSLPTATDTLMPTPSPTATATPTPVPPTATNTSTAIPVTEDTPIPATTYTLSPTSVPTETPLSIPTISAETLATSEALPTPTVTDTSDQPPENPYYAKNVGDALNWAAAVGTIGGVVVAVVAVIIVLLDSTEPEELPGLIFLFWVSGFIILGVYYLLSAFVVSMWCRIWGITPCIPGDTVVSLLAILYVLIIAIILYNYKSLMKWLDL